MKTNLPQFIVVLLLMNSYNSFAQTNKEELDVDSGIYSLAENDATHPCITNEQYAMIEKRCIENAKLFIHDSPTQKSVLSTQLNWPLKAATGFNDCSFYYIAAGVDQDPATTTFKDYNCGTVSYDGHRGTDIAIGPFPFYKMDNNQVEVIAAAPGIIIDKHDGEFDKNCVGVSSAAVANYVVIQHADGSQAMYWHMKKNSLTTKIIGQTVVAGEFIGIVGSSGSSSGPHLHFEVRTGSAATTVNDPFAGTCNLLNANSWWTSQKPYKEPGVLKASVHITDYTPVACPTTETPNESTSYTIPFTGPGLSPGYAKFYLFLRGETPGTTATMTILNPNSTVFNTWTRNCTNTANASYYGYSKLLPTNAGVYTFQVTYNGITCSQNFTIVNQTGINEKANSGVVKVYPNPSNGEFSIDFENANNQKIDLKIVNKLGQIVYSKELFNSTATVNLSGLSNGIYFVHAQSKNGINYNQKITIAK
jgi:murein DD-endopeptidase MepM/ murein hydrolase activator NlpD